MAEPNNPFIAQDALIKHRKKIIENELKAIRIKSKKLKELYDILKDYSPFPSFFGKFPKNNIFKYMDYRLHDEKIICLVEDLGFIRPSKYLVGDDILLPIIS